MHNGRSLREIRYEVAAKNARRRNSRTLNAFAAIVTSLLFLLVGASALLVLSLLIGGTYWILTGSPIFG